MHRKRCCVTSNAWPSEKTCIAAQPIKRYSHLMKMAKRLPILVSIKWKISATDSNTTTSRPRLFGPQMDLNSQTHLKQEVSNHHHTSITDLFKSEFSWSIYYRNFSTEAIVVRIYALNDWESVSYFPLGWHIKIMNQMPPINGIRLIKIHCHCLPISRSLRTTIERLGNTLAME